MYPSGRRKELVLAGLNRGGIATWTVLPSTPPPSPGSARATTGSSRGSGGRQHRQGREASSWPPAAMPPWRGWAWKPWALVPRRQGSAASHGHHGTGGGRRRGNGNGSGTAAGRTVALRGGGRRRQGHADAPGQVLRARHRRCHRSAGQGGAERHAAPWSRYAQTANEHAVPNVVFTDPELANVGRSVEQAEKDGYNASSVELPINVSGSSLHSEHYEGWAQLVVDEDRKVLLGATVRRPGRGRAPPCRHHCRGGPSAPGPAVACRAVLSHRQ